MSGRAVSRGAGPSGARASLCLADAFDFAQGGKTVRALRGDSRQLIIREDGINRHTFPVGHIFAPVAQFREHCKILRRKHLFIVNSLFASAREDRTGRSRSLQIFHRQRPERIVALPTTSGSCGV